MTPDDVTVQDIDRETARLLETVAGLDDEAVRAASLCTGWTRGHVLSHVARNAEGMVRCCRAALDGTGETMYASDRSRDDDIDSGADRSAAELLDDVRSSAADLSPGLGRLQDAPAGTIVERTPGGREIEAAKLPFMRLREVVVHHIDLDAGFGFADVEPSLVQLFLDDAVARLGGAPDAPAMKLATEEGDVHVIGEGAPYVTGSRAGVLAWLMRQQTDGVASDGPLPTLPFGG